MRQAEDETPIPRWVKVSGLIVVIIVLLVVVVLLLGGGLSGHGPSRHSGGQDGDTSSDVVSERGGQSRSVRDQ